MASLIGQLKVTLGLESASFETGVNRASSKASAMGDRMDHLGTRIGSVGKALAGAATAVAGVALVSTLKDLAVEGFHYASSIGEQAQQLGVLASELQEYHHAADQMGIDTEDMDKGLAQLTKRIGQAANGVKGPSDAFKKLGIDIHDAQGHLLTAGNAIPLIADALAKIPDPAIRAAAEVELFGKSGQKLDTLLSGGASQVNNLRDAARSLGMVLSDKQIQDADEAADKMSKLQTVLSAQVAGFVADNAKEITALAEALLKLATNAIQATNAWVKWSGATDRATDLKHRADAYLDGRKGLNDATRAQAKKMVHAQIDRENGLETTGETSYLGGLFTIKKSRLLPEAKKAQKAKLLADAGGPFDGFAPGLKDRLSWISDGMDHVAKSATGMSEKIGDASDEADQFGERGSSAAGVMKLSFEDAARGILGAVDRMGSAFKGGSFLDKLGAIIEFGIQLGGAGLFGSKVANAIHKVPGYATGTSFHPGGLAMVGERGPELVSLPRGSKVWPNGTGPAGEHGPRNYYFQGNLMTEEFWARINQGDINAARAGGQLGEARVYGRQNRRLQRLQ